MFAELAVLAQLLGILSSISALLTSRTSQGAIAWIVSLNTFPYLSVPAYWIFGRTWFNGYVKSRKEVDSQLTEQVGALRQLVSGWQLPDLDDTGATRTAECLAKLPFTAGNDVELLVDGQKAFPAMIEALAGAHRYILIQFYIVRHDHIGMEFHRVLCEAAARGVQVYFLIDEIGSHSLSHHYIRSLRKAGVRIQPFFSTRGSRNRFQLNFRNHRKIVVVDGVDGFVGGLNIGDEYLGRSRKFGPWRDTHMRITGPALVGLQLPFVEDWHWATSEYLELDWEVCTIASDDRRTRYDASVLVLPSGPADERATAGLMVQQAIHSARTRLWIASPYFVPDESVQDALMLAVLRGVDVRILIPDRPDHLVVYLSAFAFLAPMLRSGVRVFSLPTGFLAPKGYLDRRCDRHGGYREP